MYNPRLFLEQPGIFFVEPGGIFRFPFAISKKSDQKDFL
jgi:hypothetical protein